MSKVSFSLLNSKEIDPSEPPFSALDTQHVTLCGKPKEIGHFSIDSRRKIHFDRSQMKFLLSDYITTPPNIDLNHNFAIDVFQQYNQIEKIYQILFWLKHCYLKSENLNNVDFVTVRGTLSRILCSPFLEGKNTNQWEICATKVNGVIYMSAIDTDADIEELQHSSFRLIQCQSWGYKFEQYMTSDEVCGKPDLSSTTHQLEEFCVILSNKINNHRVLYKAEVDAVVPHRQPPPGSGCTACYTELKTSRMITSPNQLYNFRRYKLLQWWAQSFIAGIPEIICGKRNDSGFVTAVDVYWVSCLPEQAKGTWSSDTCLSFLDKFLSFLKKTITEDDPNVVYKFSYKAGEPIYCDVITNPSERYTVVPKWFSEEE